MLVILSIEDICHKKHSNLEKKVLNLQEINAWGVSKNYSLMAKNHISGVLITISFPKINKDLKTGF